MSKRKQRSETVSLGTNLLHMSDAKFDAYLAERPDVKVLQVMRLEVLGIKGFLDAPESNPLSKWGNQPTDVDGYHFQSKLEANRYAMLKQWQLHGIIRDLSVQYDDKPKHTWLLFRGQRLANGHKQRDIKYVDDFQYVQADTGLLIVEDTKGKETSEFLMKAKMFRQSFPHINFFVNKSIRGWYEN